jgi:hypothetical protein
VDSRVDFDLALSIYSRNEVQIGRVTMTRCELKTTLEEAGISAAMYSLDGGLPNEAYVLGGEPGDRWVTYYSERGLRRNLKVFATEAAACADLLEQVMGEPGATTAKGSW